MHVYHYAAYEPTALKRLTGRHGTRESRARPAAAGRAVRRPLRRRAAGGADQQAVLLDQEARGVLLGPHPHRRRAPGWPTRCPRVVEYERWLVERRRPRSSSRSAATTRRTCARPSPCTPGSRSGAPSSRRGPRLTRPLPGEPGRSASEERAETALAERLVEGARAAGRRRRLAPAREATRVVGLLPLQGARRRRSSSRTARPSATSVSRSEPSRRRRRQASKVWRYAFPPQDCKVLGRQVRRRRRHPRRGRQGPRPRRRRRVGRAVDGGPHRARRRRAGSGRPGPVMDQGAAREHRATPAARCWRGRAARRAPARRASCRPRRARGCGRGRQPADVVVRVGRALDGEVLAVQGPPGTGKTYPGRR